MSSMLEELLSTEHAPELIALVIAIIIVTAMLSWRKRQPSTDIFLKFGLNEKTHSLISSDLGAMTDDNPLKDQGVIGQADAIFKSRSDKRFVAGELKGRLYKGVVRRYEYYQVQLYAGLIKKKYGAECDCILAFNNKNVQFAFDPPVYEALMRNRKAAEKAKHKKKPFFSFGTKDEKPLHLAKNLTLPSSVR